MACPNHDQLRAFHLGLLPAGKIEDVHLHLEQCVQCSGLLDELEAESDDVLDAIRQPGVAATRLPEPVEKNVMNSVVDPEQWASQGSTTPDAPVSESSGPRLLGGDAAMEANKTASRQRLEKEPEPNFRGRLTSGRLVGDYELLEEVDAGGMGRIFKARHLHMGRVVAIKFLNNIHATEAISRFKREIETSAKLIHANIVTSLDAGQLGDETLYLVMEFLDGENLAERVKRSGPMDPVDAVDVIAKVADALTYLHERGIVHRDVKPHNVMLTDDGQVKLLDMGIVRLMKGGPSRSASARQLAVGSSGDSSELSARGDCGVESGAPDASRAVGDHVTGAASFSEDTDECGAELTKATAILGSLSFMAPEQAEGAFDHRADVYGLGCTAFYLLAGRPPYVADSVRGLQKAHRDSAVPSARDYCKAVSPALDRVCRRAMAKDPSERFQTMRELRAAFEDTGGGRGGGWARGVAVAMAMLMVLAGVIYRVETNTGVLVIESFDKDVEVAVKRNGEQIEIVDTRTDNRIKLRSGEYELELLQGSMQKLSADHFQLKRGDVAIVQVRAERPVELLNLPFASDKARDAQQRVAKRLQVPRYWSNPAGMEFALIPPGTMSPKTDYHQVITQPFYLGRHEVTKDQFREFVEETGYVTDSERSGVGVRSVKPGMKIENATKAGSGDGYQDWILKGVTWKHPGLSQTGSDPVTVVSFRDAQEFASWRSKKDEVRYRIPTHAEWVWAHHAGATDDEIRMPEYRRQHGWYSDDGRSTHPVGLRKANGFGLFDTFGNVFEWAGDGPLDKDAVGWELNPRYEDRVYRALGRGGCYASTVTAAHFRGYRYSTTIGSNVIGFRLLREIPKKVPVRATGMLSLSGDAEVEIDVMLANRRMIRLSPGQRSVVLPTGLYELRVVSRPRCSVVPSKVTIKSGVVESAEVMPPEIPDYELTVPFSAADAKKAQKDCSEAIGRPLQWENGVGVDFTLVPPGTLQIHDGLKATVTRPYYIGTYETTVGQFRSFVDATNYQTDPEKYRNGYREFAKERRQDGSINWRNAGFDQTDEDPVCAVSWNDALAFCKWMGKQDGRTYRLPTLAESELARSAGIPVYPFEKAERFVAHGWFGNESGLRTHPVGTKKPNAFGIHDLNGNVSEWRLDSSIENRVFWLEDPRGVGNPAMRRLSPGGNFKSPSNKYAGGGGGGADAGITLFGFRVLCETRESGGREGD